MWHLFYYTLDLVALHVQLFFQQYIYMLVQSSGDSVHTLQILLIFCTAKIQRSEHIWLGNYQHHLFQMTMLIHVQLMEQLLSAGTQFRKQYLIELLVPNTVSFMLPMQLRLQFLLYLSNAA